MRRRFFFHSLHRTGLLPPSQWPCKTWHRAAFRSALDLLCSAIASTEQAPKDLTAAETSPGHGLPLGLKGAEKPSHRDVHLLCHVFRHNAWSAALEKNLRTLNFILTAHHLIQALHVLKKESFSVTLDFFIWSTQQRGFSRNFEVCETMKNVLKENLSHVASLLETMERTQRHIPLLVFMLLMEVFAEQNMVDDAIETFKSINKFRCRPDENAYNLILAILAKNGRIGSAQDIFKQMQRDRWCRPRRASYYLFLYGLGKNGELGEARKIITEATKSGKREVVPAEAYGHLLDGLCESGQMCLAEEVITEMYELGFDPDAHAYSSLILGHASAGNMEDSYQYYVEAVQEQLLTRSQEMLELLILGFCNHEGNVKVAFKLFEEIKNGGFQLNATVCNAMVWLILHQREWQVLEEFWGGLKEKGMPLNAQICDEIVKACADSKQAELALSVLYHVVTHDDFQPSKETFRSLIRILAEINEPEYWDKLLTVVDNVKGNLKVEISATIIENVKCLDQGMFDYISNLLEKRGMYKA